MLWHIDVDFITGEPLAGDRCDDFLDCLNTRGYASVMTCARDGLAGSVGLTVEADSMVEATGVAYNAVMVAAGGVSLIVVKLEVSRDSDYAARVRGELATPA